MQMQIWGTLLIITILVISYYVFAKAKREDDKREKQVFTILASCLAILGKERKKFQVVFAGGDDNSEIPVTDAVKKIAMSADVRIKKYEQK